MASARAEDAAPADQGRLRVAHLSPDTPAVDVTVVRDGGEEPVATGVRYGNVGAYRELPAGRYAVALRAAGAAASTPPVLSTFLDLPAGAARTLALAGPFGDLALRALSDDLTAPPADSARVRVLDATPGAASLTLDGEPMGTVPAIVPGGPAELAVVIDGGSPTRLPVDLSAGSVVSLLVLQDGEGAVTVHPVIDAAAPALVPTGPVPAGGGPVGSAARALGGPPPAGTTPVRSVPMLSGPVLSGPILSVPMLSGPMLSGPVLSVPVLAAPTRVRIPAVGIDGPLEPVGLDAAGVLVPPDDVAVAGWFAGGPAPGELGPAVLAGHVDGGGRAGLFVSLGEVAVGDEVLVTGGDGAARRFTVTAVDRYPKDAFPTAAVYGATTGAELRLITCGGAFDRATGSYRDNVVVTARLASGPS